MQLALLAALIPTVASGWPPKRKVPKETEAGRPSLQVERLDGSLFPGELPLEAGGVPEGLPNDSAQGCAACHPQIGDGWAEGPHAASPSAALLEAAAGRPACTGCHLPLAAQHDELYDYEGGSLDRPVPRPNPSFRATLQNEGVTCAACHVRGGAVVVSTDEAAAAAAPHRMVLGDGLRQSEGCAACHQLSWPGAAEPLYDTFGEWSRSGFAEMGISCQACHMLGAADGSLGADHRVTIDPARAVSILLDAPRLQIVRGGPPLAATLTLQNTGAGHAFPTGTPFGGIRLAAALIRVPDGEASAPIRMEQLSVDLARKIEPEPPFATISDTRLSAGESRRYDLSLALPQEVPAGRWRLEVSLMRTLRGNQVEPVIISRGWEIGVE